MAFTYFIIIQYSPRPFSFVIHSKPDNVWLHTMWPNEPGVRHKSLLFTIEKPQHKKRNSMKRGTEHIHKMKTTKATLCTRNDLKDDLNLIKFISLMFYFHKKYNERIFGFVPGNNPIDNQEFVLIC